MPLYKAKNISVDIIIPTYRPGAEFHEVLRSLALQSFKPDNIFVVNTEEKYWDKTWEEEFPLLRVKHIKKSDFDHGGTRDMAAEKSSADIVVFMTQDAMPANDNTILELIRPIAEERAEVSYARQLPRSDADLIERYTRSFNYPDESRIKSSAELKELGIKTFFCANVCSAYLKNVYDYLGGFPHPVILNEDMILAYRAIRSGHRISYSADSLVIHSHNYSAMKQFHRNFDIGVSQAMYPEVFAAYPSEGEGKRLVKQTMKYVCNNKKPYLVFKVIWQSGWKYLGYSFGKRYKKLPKRCIMKWTMNPEFWDQIKTNGE